MSPRSRNLRPHLRAQRRRSGRGQTPVVGFDLGAVHQLDQAFHAAEFGFGKAFGEPVGLPPEVTHQFELLDGLGSRFVSGLAGPGDVTVVPGFTFSGIAVIFAGFDKPSGKFVEQIGLLHQVAACFCQWCESIDGLLEFSVAGLLLFPGHLLFVNGLVEFLDICLEDRQRIPQFLLCFGVCCIPGQSFQERLQGIMQHI